MKSYRKFILLPLKSIETFNYLNIQIFQENTRKKLQQFQLFSKKLFVVFVD